MRWRNSNFLVSWLFISLFLFQLDMQFPFCTSLFLHCCIFGGYFDFFPIGTFTKVRNGSSPPPDPGHYWHDRHLYWYIHKNQILYFCVKWTEKKKNNLSIPQSHSRGFWKGGSTSQVKKKRFGWAALGSGGGGGIREKNQISRRAGESQKGPRLFFLFFSQTLACPSSSSSTREASIKKREKKKERKPVTQNRIPPSSQSILYSPAACIYTARL